MRYDPNAGTLLQMHVCMEMAEILEATCKIDDAAQHRNTAIRHLQTSVLGADCMLVAHAHAKNGCMWHKAGRVDEAQQAYAIALRIKLAKVKISLTTNANHTPEHTNDLSHTTHHTPCNFPTHHKSYNIFAVRADTLPSAESRWLPGTKRRWVQLRVRVIVGVALSNELLICCLPYHIHHSPGTVPPPPPSHCWQQLQASVDTRYVIHSHPPWSLLTIAQAMS